MLFRSGDLAIASRLLASQAITLDAMFTELARRAAINMGEYIGAAESYGRLALKAQSNCRATLEALAKLHQPREQTVRHVHVNEGGQAVIADQFHHHAGDAKNDKSVKQSHALGAASQSAALPSPDASGYGVPIPVSARLSSRIIASSIRNSVERAPCFQALRLPLGAPLPLPPCIRHRFRPFTAGDWHSVPERVRARQRCDSAMIAGCIGLFD